jgi:hypothetical protein
MADSITIRKGWFTRTIQADEVLDSRNGQRPTVVVQRNCLGQDEVTISVPGLGGERTLHLDGTSVLYDLLYSVAATIAEVEHCETIGCRVSDGFRVQLPDNTRSAH